MILGLNEEYESRLVGALSAVESAILESSSEIVSAKLSSPSIESRLEQGSWTLEGVATIQDTTGRKVYDRFDAAIEVSCKPFSDVKCWRIQQLRVGEAIVVSGYQAGPELDIDNETDTSALQQSETWATTPAHVQSGKVVRIPPSETPAQAITGESGIPSDGSLISSPPAAPPIPPVPELTKEPDESLVLHIQEALRKKGYDPGLLDGQMGPRTFSAILTYQNKHGLSVDGKPTSGLLKHLREGLEKQKANSTDE